jgi:hypothetical protein
MRALYLGFVLGTDLPAIDFGSRFATDIDKGVKFKVQSTKYKVQSTKGRCGISSTVFLTLG